MILQSIPWIFGGLCVALMIGIPFVPSPPLVLSSLAITILQVLILIISWFSRSEKVHCAKDVRDHLQFLELSYSLTIVIELIAIQVWTRTFFIRQIVTSVAIFGWGVRMMLFLGLRMSTDSRYCESRFIQLFKTSRSNLTR